MASERQKRLAELLAEGVEGCEAMVRAGWPIETASWLGPRAREYLAKGGVEVPASAAGNKERRDAAPTKAQPAQGVGDAADQASTERLAEGEDVTERETPTTHPRKGKASSARREGGDLP